MDHKHGIGMKRVDMERGPDSAQEVDGSKARGNQQGEGKRGDQGNTLLLVGGYWDKYGCTGKGRGGGGGGADRDEHQDNQGVSRARKILLLVRSV